MKAVQDTCHGLSIYGTWAFTLRALHPLPHVLLFLCTGCGCHTWGGLSVSGCSHWVQCSIVFLISMAHNNDSVLIKTLHFDFCRVTKLRQRFHQILQFFFSRKSSWKMPSIICYPNKPDSSFVHQGFFLRTPGILPSLTHAYTANQLLEI